MLRNGRPAHVQPNGQLTDGQGTKPQAFDQFASGRISQRLKQ
jgi:hypothetical protein